MTDASTRGRSLPTVDDLSVEQKVGQLFQVGFAAGELEDALELVEEYHVGSIIYFSRNVESADQLSALSDRLQERALATDGVPLLVSTDQEGGLVTRITFDGKVPSHMAIGATDDPDLSRRVGRAIGRQLRSLGINTNLAPVFDVAMNPQKGGVVRSFGGDPDRVGAMGASMAEGLSDAGVVPTAKHFPGSGDVSADAHFSLPVADHDRDRLDRVELRPFEVAIDRGLDAVMVSHTALPAVADAETPSSLSPAVVDGILREDLGHDGLVMTDCLEMNAVADTVGVAEAALRAIEAGVDVALVSHTFERQVEAIETVREAVEDGRLSEARLDESVRRVLDLKAARNAGGDRPSRSSVPDAIAETAAVVARESVTVARDPDDRLPVDADRIQLWAAPAERVSPAEEDVGYVGPLIDRLAARGYEVEPRTLDSSEHEEAGGDGAWALPDDVTPDDEFPVVTADDRPTVADDEALLVCTQDAVRDDVQAAVVRAAEDAGQDPVVLSVRNPYDATVVPDETTFLTTYDDTSAQLDVACDVLAGTREARGTIPVSLD